MTTPATGDMSALTALADIAAFDALPDTSGPVTGEQLLARAQVHATLAVANTLTALITEVQYLRWDVRTSK